MGFLFSPILHHNTGSVEQLFVKDLERRRAWLWPDLARPRIGRARFPRILAFAVCFCHNPERRQAAGQLTPTEKGDSIHGTVVNSVTHAPIPAPWFLLPTTGRDHDDDEGRFEFTFRNLPPARTTNRI